MCDLYFLTSRKTVRFRTLTVRFRTLFNRPALKQDERKLNKSDFEKAFVQSGLDTKVTNRLFLRFEQILPQWQLFIETLPFLNKKIREKFSRLITDRWNLIEN